MSEIQDFTPITFGMAVYDDFDGLYFTLKAVQLYHKNFFYNVEIIVVDNHPMGKDGAAIKHFCEQLKPFANIRYIPMETPVGTSPARQRIFDEATGNWVLVCDCHVLFDVGALDKFMEYCAKNPESKDIVTGPLLYENGKAVATHFVPKWRGQMFGIWGTNIIAEDPNAEPFEIPGCGLGVFACRKQAWPGFHPASRGFGGEELYIHEKIRRNGGSALCLPFLRWAHRFGRPRGVPYPLQIWQRVRNYVLEYQELGWDVNELYNYFVGGGFFSREDLELLMEDPLGRENPPHTIFVANDAPEKSKIEEFINNQNTSKPKLLDQIQKAVEIKELSQRVKTLDDLPLEEQQRIRQRLEELKKEAQANSEEKRCCGDQLSSEQRELLNTIAKAESLEAVYGMNLNSNIKEYREVFEKYIKDAKLILEIGDDPLGSTLTVLRNMSSDARFITHYKDRKHIPLLHLLGAIATKKEGKTVEIKFDDIAQIPPGVDLLIIDPIIPNADFVFPILKMAKDNVKRIILCKTDKYGIMDAEKKPGLLPAVTTFLKASDWKWSVIMHERAGLGLTILSQLKEDKPSLPPLTKMVSNFAQAVVKHIATGMREVSKEVLEERLKVCTLCKHRNDERCSICGCFIVAKAKMADQPCPLGFWTDLEIKEQVSKNAQTS